MTPSSPTGKRRADIKRGHGFADRPVAGEVWTSERSRPDDPALGFAGNLDPENRSVDFARYFDPAFAQAEVEHVWRKSWLFAAREEDIPEVGDRVPFDMGPLSWVIVRTAPDDVRAFFNACLHRGTRLCSKAGSASSIRCPYHGWEWDNEGSLKRIPSHWDFPDSTRANTALPQARVARWGGFIFINADPDAAPLEAALGVVPEHFRDFAPERRHTAARLRKLVRANWKVAQEAFQEAYHLYTTHPEAVPFAADAQTQYDVWEGEHGHIGRNAGCSAMPSAHAPAETSVFEATRMFAESMRDWHYPGAELPELDPAGDLRAQLADWHRARMAERYGWRSNASDAVMIDSILYFIFPHVCLWLSEPVPFTYHFSPHPTNPEQSYFEVRMLLPVPAGEPVPRSSPCIEIGPEESVFEKAPAFGFLGYVFDQDMSNMPLVQLGMHAASPQNAHTRLGIYQESIIQHWNAVLDRMIAGK